MLAEWTSMMLILYIQYNIMLLALLTLVYVIDKPFFTKAATSPIQPDVNSPITTVGLSVTIIFFVCTLSR